MAQPLGPGTVAANFGGDAFYLPSSDQKATLLFDFLARGAFVLDDHTAVNVAAPVTFWGAQWFKDNVRAEAPAPSSFKGFAANLPSTPPTCGEAWSTGPGNSFDPPDSVPSYMAVIVSSQISQNGSTLTGDTLMILVVKTDSGYAPNPGHAGTGVLVASPSNPGVPAQVCHSYNVTQGGGRLRPSPSRLRLGLEIIRMHRFQRLLSLLFMALALVLGPAGASASCPADATPDARAEGDVVSSYGQLPAGSGAIEGQVERSGIDPRRGGAGGKDPLAPVTGDPISIRDISGEVVAQAVTGQDGSFRVVLPAARYSVTEDILGTTQTLDVVDQMTSSVVLVLSVSR